MWAILQRAAGLAPPGLRHLVYRHRGLHAVARRFAALIYPGDEWQWVDVERGPFRGMRLWVRPRTHKFVLSGRFEPEVQRELGALLRPGSVLWDVGANVGAVSLLAARLVGPQGRVVAFEPDPDNVGRLRRNLEANHADNVDVVEAAVGAGEGTAHFQPGDGGGETGRVVTGRDGIEVALTSLDAAAGKGLPPPDVVKLDVEGLEVDVLRGGRELLGGRRPALVVEVHEAGNEARLREELEPLGYALRRLSRRHVVALPQAGG